MDYFVRSDIVHAVSGRHSEDGEPLEALSFYVVAQSPDGHRWAHCVPFLNGEVYTHPEGYRGFASDEGQAEAKAEALCARIRAADRKLDPDAWIEIDPEYGSEAYQGLAAVGYFRDAEIRRAEDNGEIAPGSVY